ncbi:MAG: creatininase family protein [Thermosphaera sp.]
MSGAIEKYLEAKTATLPEVKAFLTSCPAAILPLGATEQHGPHLPLATDTLLAEAFARRVARKSCGLILPAVPLGYSWTWRNIPGTLTLSLETLMIMLQDIAASLERTDVKALCIITGHEANRQPIKYALREKIADRFNVHVLHLFYPGLEEVLSEAETKPWHHDIIHADEIETSFMLAEYPELVQMASAVADYPQAPTAYGSSVVTMGDIMRTGIFGDPTAASVEKGERWLEYSATKAAELWLRFLREHRIEGAP